MRGSSRGAAKAVQAAFDTALAGDPAWETIGEELFAVTGVVDPARMTTNAGASDAQRAAIGFVPGQLVLLAGLVFHATWLTVAIVTLRSRRGAGRTRPPRAPTDRTFELAIGAG